MIRIAAAGVLTGLFLTTAPSEAALVDVHLITATVYGTPARNLDLSDSTATWQYDDVGRTLIQTGGVFDAAYKIGPPTTVWTHRITGAIFGPAFGSAGSFACVEGNYGVLLGRNYCAGYNFGDNFIDESTSSWGPGLAYSRNIGGDDQIYAEIFTVGVYGVFREISWDGQTLQFANAGCYRGGSCEGLPNGWDAGTMFTLQAATVVPLPAGGWLLATGLAGLLGARGRRLFAHR